MTLLQSNLDTTFFSLSTFSTDEWHQQQSDYGYTHCLCVFCYFGCSMLDFKGNAERQWGSRADFQLWGHLYWLCGVSSHSLGEETLKKKKGLQYRCGSSSRVFKFIFVAQQHHQKLNYLSNEKLCLCLDLHPLFWRIRFKQTCLFRSSSDSSCFNKVHLL